MTTSLTPSPPRRFGTGRSPLIFSVPPPYPGYARRMASLTSLYDQDKHNHSSGYVSTNSSSSESEHESLSEAAITWTPPRNSMTASVNLPAYSSREPGYGTVGYGTAKMTTSVMVDRPSTTFPVLTQQPSRWSLATAPSSYNHATIYHTQSAVEQNHLDSGCYDGVYSSVLSHSLIDSMSSSTRESTRMDSPTSIITDTDASLPPMPSLPSPSASMSSSMIGKRESRSSMRTQSERDIEKWRRRSVPASMRDAFTEDVMRILEKDGHVKYQTDVDTGLRSSQLDVRAVNRPESVLELARKFAEINAVQELEKHKKRSLQHFRKPAFGMVHSTKSVGGIASLSLSKGDLRVVTPTTPTTMSRVNVFKQMDAQNRPAVPVQAPRSPNSIKDALLRWVQNRVQEYPVEITNFSSSWADGYAFCALIHRFAPHSFDFATISRENRKENFDLAFRVAEEHGIPALLETEDMIMMGDKPDWKCVFTYVQQFYKHFRERP